MLSYNGKLSDLRYTAQNATITNQKCFKVMVIIVFLNNRHRHIQVLDYSCSSLLQGPQGGARLIRYRRFLFSRDKLHEKHFKESNNHKIKKVKSTEFDVLLKS